MAHFFDTLEPRKLFATYTFADGLITVVGSNKRDFVSLYAIKDSYALELNGTVKAAFKKKDVTGIIMWGYGGDDRLAIGNFNVPTTLIGGDGKDTLIGGKADDILDGGPGNDNISGRDGSDILRGDMGSDTLKGGNGDDFLYAGLASETNLKIKDSVEGGNGNDTVLTTTGFNETPRIKTVEVTQPDTFRPTGRLFPESTSYISPTITTVLSTNNDVLATINYTLPTTNAQFLSPGIFRARSTGKGDNYRLAYILPVLALSFGGDATGSPTALSASYNTPVLPPSKVNNPYFIALASPEDPTKKTDNDVVANDFIFKSGFFGVTPITAT